MVVDFLEISSMVFNILSKEELDALIEEDEYNKIRKYKYDLAIHKVAGIGDLVGVKYLLKKGYKVTDKNHGDKRRVIHSAVASNNFKLVEFLLNNKAKTTCLDLEGNTPLHYVSKDTPLDTIKLLIKNGADIKAINKEITTDRYWTYPNPVFLNVLLTANKEVLDFFIKKRIKLSQFDIRRALSGSDIDNFIFIMGHLKSINYNFDDMSYFDLNSRYVISDYRKIRNNILNNKKNDLSIYSGDKEVFYFEMPGFNLKMKYTSLLVLALYSDKIEDIKFIIDNKLEGVSDIIFAISIAIYKNKKSKELKYLIENYYNNFNPFRIVTKDEKETLLSLILKVYLAVDREELLNNLLKNSYIEEYRKDNDLDNNLEIISNHYIH